MAEKIVTGTGKVIQGYRITIDDAIRKALNLQEGDIVEYTIKVVTRKDDQNHGHAGGSG